MTTEQLITVILADIALVVVLARIAGWVFGRLRQPPVVGEILAGIALGPSLIGLAAPGLPHILFPADALSHLEVIADLGLVLFMFLIGLEFDTRLIRGHGRVAAAVSVSSVALPMALGVGLAVWLHSGHGNRGGDFVPFALFIGASMSVTAFPVLARILTDRGMYGTRTGALTMASAAIDDVLAWLLLAVVVAVAQGQGLTDLFTTLSASSAFVAVMLLIVRPSLVRLGSWHRRAGRLSSACLAAITSGALLSAAATGHIGIHPIFGAFLFGAVMPRAGAARLVTEIRHRLEPLVVTVLLPVFFIVTGSSVDIAALDGRAWGEFAAVLAVACVSKFCGAAGAARLLGVNLRRATAVGILMNTRGLTELVILSIGLELMVIDQTLFTVMVLMAVSTTVMAEPLLRSFYSEAVRVREVEEAAALHASDTGSASVSPHRPWPAVNPKRKEGP